MTISEVARRLGLTPKMIRYYEAQGLIPAPPRSAAGYRHYAEQDIARLTFIRRARQLDFSLPQIAELLALWESPERASREVRRVAQQRLVEVNDRLHELEAMKRSLEAMVTACPGDESPHCPILQELTQEAARKA